MNVPKYIQVLFAIEKNRKVPNNLGKIALGLVQIFRNF